MPKESLVSLDLRICGLNCDVLSYSLLTFQILAPFSKLPYVFKLIPVTHVDPRHYTDEPFNNPRNFQILEEGVKHCSRASISVSDSHYMDLAGVCYSILRSLNFEAANRLQRNGESLFPK